LLLHSENRLKVCVLVMRWCFPAKMHQFSATLELCYCERPEEPQFANQKRDCFALLDGLAPQLEPLTEDWHQSENPDSGDYS
jgi:hypothetical protein